MDEDTDTHKPNAFGAIVNVFQIFGAVFGFLALIVGMLGLIFAVRNPQRVEVILESLGGSPMPTCAPDPTASACTPAATYTPYPTYTPRPTHTPYSTQTPWPTYTPANLALVPIGSATAQIEASPLGEGQPLEIEPGIFVELRSTFGAPNSSLCWAPSPGFNLVLEVENRTTRQFLLRFEEDGFAAIGNSGTVYTLNATGINSCSSDSGLRSRIMNPGDEASIVASFAGEIGLDTTAVFLTVENISGHGPYVFQKDV